MISPAYVQLMARYNAWQNRSLYGAATGLSEAERHRDRGAFFGSIQATLAHLMFGDQIWMHRLAGTPPARARTIPESTTVWPDWAELVRERHALDAVILHWAESLDPATLDGDLTYYSGAMKREFTRPRWLIVTHMFNHQTHHRGQVHAMLTAAGARPDDTDIPFMPDLD